MKTPKKLYVSENSDGTFSAIVYLTEKEAIDSGRLAHEYTLSGIERKKVIAEIRKWTKSRYVKSCECSACRPVKDLILKLKEMEAK